MFSGHDVTDQTGIRTSPKVRPLRTGLQRQTCGKVVTGNN
jgi:hypothetical protein